MAESGIVICLSVRGDRDQDRQNGLCIAQCAFPVPVITKQSMAPEKDKSMFAPTVRTRSGPYFQNANENRVRRAQSRCRTCNGTGGSPCVFRPVVCSTWGTIQPHRHGSWQIRRPRFIVRFWGTHYISLPECRLLTGATVCWKRKINPKLSLRRAVAAHASAIEGGSRVAGRYSGCYVRTTVSGEFFRPCAGE